jgi:branched-chain amino acid transport system substrate-binding protein
VLARNNTKRWTLGAKGGLAMQHHAFAGLWLISAAALVAGPAQAQQPAAAAPDVKLGIVSFLTGPAAAPFGIPGRNAAEIVIEALNSGKAPAPYNTPGLGGAKIVAKYVDEVGSTANQVTEYRNLVQRDNVDPYSVTSPRAAVSRSSRSPKS